MQCKHNIIAQNLYTQLDSEGHHYVLLEEILHYKKDDAAVPYENCFVISSNGNIYKSHIAKGWYLCMQWNGGSTSWEALKDVRESFPVQVAEFAISWNIQDEPTFAWWVKYTLTRKNRVIKTMKTCHARKTH
jgi:hypothetical protein